jgi:hypothetical protein
MPRAQVIALLADAMEVPEQRRSALLGRFQHLQRLALVEGINPGRGKAAEYRPHQILIIAIAFQMLQLGLTPERAVQVIKQDQDRVRLAMGLAVNETGTITPALLWFDPSILTRSQEGSGIDDLAEATFDYGGAGSGVDVFKWLFVEGWVQRMAFVSISGTLWHIVAALEGHFASAERPTLGGKSLLFLEGLKDWFENSTPDSLA